MRPPLRPLTHHTQLRASILADALGRTGVGVDRARLGEKARRLEAARSELAERLRRRGYLPGQAGSGKALQSILAEFRRRHPGASPHPAAAAGRLSTREEDLLELAPLDGFFRDLLLYRAADNLLTTYLAKLGRGRLHARYDFLVATGRTACGGGLNLQNLPREAGEGDAAATVRGCFVPAPGRVFIDADYRQIELVAWAYAVSRQFGARSELARLINAGEDVHRLLAAAVLGKPPEAVTAAERGAVKAVSFGRPGGMGPARLRQAAKNAYGIDLSEAEVGDRIRAYHALCPELDAYLHDEVDAALRLAEHLRLTPADYSACRGEWAVPRPEDRRPQGWVGGMLLKVLGDPSPVTRQGRPYDAAELEFFWGRAAPLAGGLDDRLRRRLEARLACPALAGAVRDRFGRRAVFTATGRLRADASFSAARNTVFQGLAADGAVLGLWRVWRAGYRVVAFVHDQVVVEVDADGHVPDRVRELERLMVDGMREVLPGMRVCVESAVTRSLNRREVDPRYAPGGGAAPAA